MCFHWLAYLYCIYLLVVVCTSRYLHLRFFFAFAAVCSQTKHAIRTGMTLWVGDCDDGDQATIIVLHKVTRGNDLGLENGEISSVNREFV